MEVGCTSFIVFDSENDSFSASDQIPAPKPLHNETLHKLTNPSFCQECSLLLPLRMLLFQKTVRPTPSTISQAEEGLPQDTARRPE